MLGVSSWRFHTIFRWCPQMSSPKKRKIFHRANRTANHPNTFPIFPAQWYQPSRIDADFRWFYRFTYKFDCWLVVDYPSEKYEFVSWDYYSQYGKSLNIFQTTNQMEKSQYTCQQCRVKYHMKSWQQQPLGELRAERGYPVPLVAIGRWNVARLIQSFQVDFGSFGDSIFKDSKRLDTGWWYTYPSEKYESRFFFPYYSQYMESH